MYRPLLVFIALVISGCSTLAAFNWNQIYGISDPTAFDLPRSSDTVSFQEDVKPILDNRCVVCHACYDAPCQLKLGSHEGITRGANKTYIYNSTRLVAANTSRLHHDAELTSQWRKKNFFPVLNERQNTPEANINASVMAQMLLQKQQFPLPETDLLPDTFDFKLHRDQQCTNIENYSSYKSDYPLWGMPYGLPGLTQQQHDTLITWLEQGAPSDVVSPITPSLQTHINTWEQFLNQDSLKAQLMSRYIYEHLFLAHLYFEDSSTPIFFEMVRSATAPGQPISLITTRRPYDDPGVDRVYYRLRPVKDTIVFKTHMPYRLDAERKNNWDKWFLQAQYSVTTLPSYKPETASNPFKTFEQIPSYARYRFMLEEAQFTIMGYIKGPVCRGQVALNVINDHFWVVFIDPESRKHELSDKFLSEHVNQLQLPAEKSSTAGLHHWISYSEQEMKYSKARIKELNQHVDKAFHLDLNMLWSGDGDNDNAALTIFRHFDSASVIKGLHGDKPQTAWVITYPLLERIHYLLVAGFDVYGNVGHQLNTRIYMDFLRMEGEFNFLAFLPKEARQPVLNQWYRGSINQVKEHIFEYAKAYKGNTSVQFNTQDPLQEMYVKLQDHLAPVLSQRYKLKNGFKNGTTLELLSELSQVRGIAASVMPQSAILEVVDSANGQSEYFTILSNNTYTNISHLFGEEERRLPEEDYLTVGYGVIGPYPNVFLRAYKEQLPGMLEAVKELKTPQDYREFLDTFAVRRSSPAFWLFSDKLHEKLGSQYPISFGMLDYNRLDNK